LKNRKIKKLIMEKAKKVLGIRDSDLLLNNIFGQCAKIDFAPMSVKD
jgi:hypothetical protein